MRGKYTRNLCHANYCFTDVIISTYSRCVKFTCLLQSARHEIKLQVKFSKIVPHVYPAGVPVMQHPALSWTQEDYTLDSLDTRQHFWQRRPLRTAFPLHLQSSNPRPGPSGSGSTEDRDALLLQRWLHWLLHWRWVRDGDRWSLSSRISLWLFSLLLSNWLSGPPQAGCCPPRLKQCLLSV